MKQYEIKIVGANKLIQNKLSKELNDEIKTIPRGKMEEWEEKNWYRRLYTDGENIIFPEKIIHAVLLNGCKKYKVPPPRQVGRTWTEYVKSCVIIPESAVLGNVDAVSVIKTGKSMRVVPFGDYVGGNPSSGKKSSKVWKVRPMIMSGWTATIKCIDAEGTLNKEAMRGIVEAAGTFVGFCDWRPLHGRFTVESIKEVELDV